MRSLTLTFFIVCFNFVFAQEIPPIQNFTPLDYKGENQNWDIAQGVDNHIYVANNHNLLAYDGVRWNSYQSPNASVFRSIAAKDSLIFTGQYLEFGFWKKDGFGDLNYTSISEHLQEPMLDDEEFWNIVTLEDWVLFQSLDRIYSYNTQTHQFKVLEAKSIKAHLFKVENSIYFQDQNSGIYKVENGELKLILDGDVIKHSGVVGMHKDGDELVVVLDNAQFMKIRNGERFSWNIPATNQLKGVNVYCSERLADGSYVLGTISQGIVQISGTGELIRKIDQRKGINNNTVLSIFQDKDENLWLGLDNGLSVINIKSPFKEYVDNLGLLGLVYTSKLYNDNLYLGTNQGLFLKARNGQEDFKLIKSTDGQVWSLKEIDGVLFCGHNKGTFIINDDRATLISTLPGTWDIKAIQGKPKLILQGNYDGLSLLKKENGSWVFGNKISGFDTASRFFEVLDDGKILVNHEYKGLYELSLDSAFSKIKSFKTHPIMGHGSSILKYRNDLIYTSLDATFKKEDDSLSFQPDTTLIRLLFTEAGGVTSIMMPDEEAERFWCFTQSGLTYVSSSTFDASLEARSIPIPVFFRKNLGVLGFENLTRIGHDQYLIGVSNGYVVLDVSKVKESFHEVKINHVTNSDRLRESHKVQLSLQEQFDYNQNSISFYYGVAQFDKYNEVSYQSRLIGLDENWSPWSTESNISYNGLKFGDYTFQVRAKVGNAIAANISEYSFSINRPWYWSIVAMVMYAMALIIGFFGVHKLYKSYYTKKQDQIVAIEKRKLKRKKLKTEKELIQLKNEKLKSEIEAKNRELAVATMSMIKKNEFLNTIKNQLNKISNTAEIKSVIKTIDKSINNEDDWKFFEKAFNNADKNFLNKIKQIHPELTPNDLKLCAYLRLNLSSKDIAPLLNISVRSVEVKRYRLRKKMNLLHEDGLVNYIIGL